MDGQVHVCNLNLPNISKFPVLHSFLSILLVNTVAAYGASTADPNGSTPIGKFSPPCQADPLNFDYKRQPPHRHRTVVLVDVAPDARWSDPPLWLIHEYRQDERCSAAVDKDCTVLGSHRSVVLVGVALVAC